MQSIAKKRVGILRGGAGEHYTSSLRTGGEIISQIFENLSDKYKPVDILIDKKGVWHINGVPIMPADLMYKIDIAWNTAQPSVSVILDNFSIPNVGAGSFSYALENSQDLLREHMKQIGVQMPRSYIVKKALGRSPVGEAKEVFQKFPSPWIVKSFASDSNMGIQLAKTFPELVDAISEGVEHEKSILVEEFIAGKVASVYSVAGFRGENIYTFPPGPVFGKISASEKEKLVNLARILHSHMGAKHYLKSSFVLNKRGKVYLLNVDGNPDLRPNSYFNEVCESVGAKMHHVVEHILG
jgi:D-alanine-D-alanine ligase-like ATP-grasp enzyme